MIPLRFVVSEDEAGARLDRFLHTHLPDVSRSLLQRLIERSGVSVDDRPARQSEKVRAGQVIQVDTSTPEPVGLVPTEIPLDVVFENPDILVVNKPAGLVVHPAPGHAADTLANALMARYPGLAVGNALRPGIVHRLDRGTSGLMVVALNDRAYASLIDQMKHHQIQKEYLALAHGTVGPERGVIDAPIGREREDRKKMGIVESGRAARTGFEVVERFPGYTLLRLKLETGRTHQIRVHLAAIGHPIVGDVVYGARTPALGLTRPFLHAWHLGFQLPGEEVCFAGWTKLPADLEAVLDRLRAE
ncbi:MAG TPA: RluA family pseudouridine synthase [Chloroflexota bacterium]|nr:RluA family pseudouridine synthase [Chloroflexota bacterium]